MTPRGAGPPLIAALVAGFTALLPVAMFAVAIDNSDSDAWFTGWADLARDLALLGVGIAAAGSDLNAREDRPPLRREKVYQ